MNANKDRRPEMGVISFHCRPAGEIFLMPAVAYKVDDLEKYIADADSVICGPMEANEKGDRLAFITQYTPSEINALTKSAPGI